MGKKSERREKRVQEAIKRNKLERVRNTLIGSVITGLFACLLIAMIKLAQ